MKTITLEDGRKVSISEEEYEFKDVETAELAREILGEETIKTALL